MSLTTFADNELDTLTLSFANDTEYKYIKFQFNSLFSGWGQIYEIKINGVVACAGRHVFHCSECRQSAGRVRFRANCGGLIFAGAYLQKRRRRMGDGKNGLMLRFLIVFWLGLLLWLFL